MEPMSEISESRSVGRSRSLYPNRPTAPLPEIAKLSDCHGSTVQQHMVPTYVSFHKQLSTSWIWAVRHLGKTQLPFLGYKSRFFGAVVLSWTIDTALFQGT
jgi:hypothetical protein